MTVRAALAVFLLTLLATASFFLFQTTSNADDPPTWDFEQASDLDDWTPVAADLSRVAGEGVDDSYAGAINVTTQQTTATIVHHVEDVQPGRTYTFSGAYTGSAGGVSHVTIKVEFLFSGGPPLTQAAPSLYGAGAFTPVEAAAPCETIAVNVYVIVTGPFDATAYVDDLSLKTAPQATPCPTATPTITQTPSPTASATSTETPFPSETPSPTASSTATPSASATFTQTPSATSSATTTPDPTSTITATATSVATATDTDTPPAIDTAVPPTDTPVPTAETPAPSPTEGVVVDALDFANGGFEQATDGVPDRWHTVGGLLTQSDGHVRSGAWAGAFFSSTSSTKWAYQTVSVVPANWYEFNAFVYQNDPWVESALLRVSWYASDDGTGSAIAQADSTEELADADPTFRQLTTGPVMSPPGAHSARLRALMRPVDATNAVIYIDDASFAKVAAPLPPTPTPSPTLPLASLTPTPPPPTSTTAPGTPTSTPVSPSSTPTSTPRPVATSTPAPAPTATSATNPTSEPAAIPATLQNAGFEQVDGGEVVGWQTYGGVLGQSDTHVRSGAYAGAFFSASSSTKWAYQTVAVDPEAWYRFDAFVYHDHPGVESAFLRASWYASADGSGSALLSVDSATELTDPQPAFRPLSTGSVQAPPGAHSAKLRVMLRPRGETSALISIDDAAFARVAAPPFAEETTATTSTSSSPSSTTSPSTSGRSQVLSSTSTSLSSPTSNQSPETSDRALVAPVIRRDSLRAPAVEPPHDGGNSLWLWGLFGGAIGAGIVGWASYLVQRRPAS